jgi:hypothetical protein
MFSFSWIGYLVGAWSESKRGDGWYQLEVSHESGCGRRLAQVIFCSGRFELLRGPRLECIELLLSDFIELFSYYVT